MIYRGLYHFYVAHQKGVASDPVKYFAAPSNQDLGIVKQLLKPNVKLIVGMSEITLGETYPLGRLEQSCRLTVSQRRRYPRP
ncbi:hypothetical protein MC7420_1486 [Coleofasciculus chthonoplastes PCC 7420]|uniref:Uncharacterized protein n=1 Tax=Coleofasciculus chthonoplastes PCC 7420 TaxID=118168 RepID=B4VR54_9CYAN|nr:hypothetical protein MC7420_1486 [Coleofasciculus chthonoplastes PCC 7420]